MLSESQIERGKYVDIGRIKQTVDAGPYDAVLVVSPENVPYYSGFWNFDLRGIPERIHYVLWPKGGEPAWVVPDKRKNFLVPGETFLEDVIPYTGEEVPDSINVVADVLHERGVRSGRVGFEGRTFPAGHLMALQRRLPQVQFEDAFTLLESVRLLKTPGEIELLERLTGWTTAAIDAAFAAAQPGDTERAIVARMQYELLLRGADMMAFPAFGAGERTGYLHGLATDKVVEPGMLLKTDFGGFKDGYYSDVARTVCLGKASDQQKDRYARLQEIKHRTVDFIKPGMLASEVATYTQALYQQLGLEYKWAIIGHSIGLGIHESPQIYPWVHEPILPGMAMMIEIGYSDYPHDSYHVEDLIVVTERGAEYRSDYSKHETLWEIGV
jgi:Xaa-Pro aminopeptidase